MAEEASYKQFLTRYKIANYIIMKGDEKIQLDYSNILSIELLNDYDFNIMPLLKVTIRVDVRRRMWILKNKKELIVKFELDQIGLEPEGEEYLTGEEKVWNIEFSPYFNDEEESIDTDVLDERLSMNEGVGDFSVNKIDEENYYETQNLLDMYLFHPGLLKSSRFAFNRVYTEDTLQNIVSEMLTASKHEKVLMSKFENDEIYKEMLLPPNPVYKCRIYLDQYYGLYEKGGMIYYDLEKLYILNLNGKLTAKEEEEWEQTTFIVPALDANLPGSGMRRVEGEKIFYIMVPEENVNPQKSSTGTNIEKGAEARIVEVDSVETGLSRADQSFVEKRNETVIFSKRVNKYANSVVKARMEENDCLMYINAENLDITAFTPNKMYRMVFSDPLKHEKYGKNEYRLAYAHHYLKIETDQYMISSHQIVLKKTGGPESAKDPDAGIFRMSTATLGKELSELVSGMIGGFVDDLMDKAEDFVGDVISKGKDMIDDAIDKIKF